MVSGALPFIAGALLLVFGINALPLLGSVSGIVAAYTLVIVVFLTGIHWGQQLSLGKTASGLFISSNIIAVAVWLCWLLLSQSLFLALMPLVLLMMLYIDRRMMRKGVISSEYYFYRLLISTLVIISLLISALYT